MEVDKKTTKNSDISDIQENVQNSDKIIKTKWFKWFLVAILFVVISIVVFLFVMKELPWGMEKRGQLGDMFGVVGALFSGLAFAGVIVTMLQQNEDLNLQRKDLALQRQEIAQTNKELELQRNEMKKQNRTIMLQRFENTFFNMLKMQQSILINIEFKNIDQDLQEPYNVEDCRGRRSISKILDFFRKYSPTDINGLLMFCSSTFNDSRVEPYFQQIYLILDHVDSANWLTGIERYIYICMLRATFSTDELTLLFYYGLYKNKTPKFKELIEKYALFMNLRKMSLFSEAHYDLYERGAYEYITSDPIGTEKDNTTI